MEHLKGLSHEAMSFSLSGVWHVLRCSCGNTFKYTHRPERIKRRVRYPGQSAYALTFNQIKGYTDTISP